MPADRPQRRPWRLVVLAGLLVTAAFVVALWAVLKLTVVDCETSPRPGAPRGVLCDAPYDLLVIPPPALVIAGAVLSWRRGGYAWLIAGSVAAAAVIGLIVDLPRLYPD